MAEQAHARALLAQLEDLAMRSLQREVERLRQALEAGDEAGVARARMAALDALELFERTSGAASLARQEAWAEEDGHEP